MGDRSDLTPFGGSWRGTWRTWVEPDQLYNESAVEAAVEVLYGGRGALLRYEATLEGPVSGLALLGSTQDGAVVSWMDTWHTSGLIMAGRGEAGEGRVSVATTYRAEGAEWRWSSDYLLEDGRLVVRHFNEGPDLPRYLGVEMVMERVAGA